MMASLELQREEFFPGIIEAKGGFHPTWLAKERVGLKESGLQG